jgi:hypothetical protein
MRTMALFSPILLLTNLLAWPALAAEEAKQEPMLCHLNKTLICSERSDCSSGLTQNLDLPDFLKIAVDQRTISGERPDGKLLTTRIDNLTEAEGRLILSGSEDGVGWNILIVDSSKKLVLMLSDEQVVAVIFGICTHVPGQ